ncbi:hypothetical protein THIOM_000271 [Candidatus Thiomargarita nelsonii]|uniref:Uncharacterized protein n=1 Tax=Candidatus Thiomargarita nelsonii TaxID=1003181 RepID=A0A176S6X9_9GAMM|nr:hypothetical protein THIOM_000271 [Candidatus Thiomargarita nelsonii]
MSRARNDRVTHYFGKMIGQLTADSDTNIDLALSNPLMDDIITLGKFISIAQNLVRVKSTPHVRNYFP